MAGNGTSKLSALVETASLLGESAAMSMLAPVVVPQVLGVFAEYDHEDLRRFVIVDYPLVENDTPEPYRNALRNLGSNPRLREQWAGLVTELVTPEHIKQWLRTPGEWLDDDRLDAEATADQRAEMRRCADVLDEHPKGDAWLEAQVMDLYRICNVVPEDAAVREVPDGA